MPIVTVHGPFTKCTAFKNLHSKNLLFFNKDRTALLLMLNFTPLLVKFLKLERFKCRNLTAGEIALCQGV